MSDKYIRQWADPKGSLIEDSANRIVFGSSTTVPADGTAGYQPGCLFIDNDSATIGAMVYFNEGTLASCAFKPLPSLTPLSPGTRLVASGAALTITQALHDGKTVVLAAAAAITLPAMTGSGSRYRFVCGIDATAVTITATGAHLFGTLFMNTDTGAGTLFTAVAATSTGSTIITFDGVTKGGRKGDWVEIEDVATSVGVVKGMLNGSGTEATPYS